MSDSGEAAFLAAYTSETFPKPSVTVDVVLIGIRNGMLQTVLVRRNEQPARGRWALPGGFVRLDESLDAAAARVLREKAQITDVYLEQLYTFGRPDRDPRMRIITVAYYALVERAVIDALPAENDIKLFTINAGPAKRDKISIDLLDERGVAVRPAFDHRDIVALTVTRLRGKLNYAPVGYELLPKHFTLLELAHVHEVILGTRVNKDSFRRRMLASGELVPTGTIQDGVDHRPAALYRRAPQGAKHG